MGIEPKKASDFLRGIVREVGQKKSRDVFAVALDSILAANQRDACQVMGFRDGKLTLEVSSAPLFAELSSFRREEIRLRINQAVPERQVAQLQFRLGGTGHV
jgi:hypothetical protein